MTELHGRRGGRREIPWHTLDRDALDSASCDRVGATWVARMRAEHLAVGAFALLTSELAAEGCPSVVLSMLAQASADEVRHAEVCRRLAERLLGSARVPRNLRGVPDVPKHTGMESADRALLHVVEMCCLSETFTGVYLTEMLARATNAAVRAALESLLEDEIDHGKVGWAYLASLPARRRASPVLASALPDMLERTVGWVIDRAAREPEPDAPELEALGYLGNDAGSALAMRTLEHVVLPGFVQLGVELELARERIRERGWRSTP